MKTKKVLFWMCACMMAVAALAYAADSNEPASGEGAGVQAPARQARPLPGRGPVAAPAERGRGPAAEGVQRPAVPTTAEGREDVLRQAMARRMEVHREEIAKLEAILKIAEEEKAEKTAAALKALIAEKDKEIRDQIDQAERRRIEMQERLQERLEDRSQRPAPAPRPDTPARPGTEGAPRGARPAPQRGQQ